MTAETFLAHIRTALEEGWGYIWGTAGQVWTAEDQKKSTREMTVKYGSRWIGRRVTDCSGLLAWAARQGGASLPHGSNSIWRNCLSASGELTPDTLLAPGTAVFKRSASGGWDHVGVWDGERVIEARGTRYGVVASSLKGWTHWGTLRILDGSDPAPLRGVCAVRAARLNLREGPSVQTDRLAALPRDTRVTVLRAADGGWCEVEVRLTGYVMQKYLAADPL